MWLQQHVAVSSAGAAYSYYNRARKEWLTLQPALDLVTPRDKRMVLAYLSSDLLTGHAVAGSMREVPRLHEQSRFKVYVYVVKHDQVVAAVDKERSGLAGATLVDAHAAEMSELAQWINDAGTHVVVDCNGQTGREHLPALAMRPAALHVHYLGFPSTIGATYIDLIIGDAVVSPPELVGYYTEKLLILPTTFQVTSHKTRQARPFADGRASPLPPWKGGREAVGYLESEEDLRVYHGYPPEGPLLCNWNQHFKLDPEFFSVWARIVKQVRAADFPDIPAGAVLTGTGWLPTGAKQHIGYAPVPGGVGITCRACSKLIRASSVQLSACLLQRQLSACTLSAQRGILVCINAGDDGSMTSTGFFQP